MLSDIFCNNIIIHTNHSYQLSWLASIKPEISQVLTSLLEEIRAADDAKLLRTAVSNSRRPAGPKVPYKGITRPNRPAKSCPLCKQAGQPESGHFLTASSQIKTANIFWAIFIFANIEGSLGLTPKN